MCYSMSTEKENLTFEMPLVICNKKGYSILAQDEGFSKKNGYPKNYFSRFSRKILRLLKKYFNENKFSILFLIKKVLFIFGVIHSIS